MGYVPIAGPFSVLFLRKSATFIVVDLRNLGMVPCSRCICQDGYQDWPLAFLLASSQYNVLSFAHLRVHTP